MPLISVSSVSGFYFLRSAITDAMIDIDVELSLAMAEVTQSVADELRDNSPIGFIKHPDAPNPPGDGDGALAYSYTPQVAHYTPGRAGGRVSTSQPTKMKFVRYGTGIYGPSGRRIYPKPPRKVLRWVDWNGVHFARSVAGQEPNDFVTPVVSKGLAEGKALCAVAVGSALQTALAGL